MVKIYMVTDNNKPVFLENARSKEAAQAKIRYFQKMDKYETTTGGYINPIPFYYITNSKNETI